MHADVFVEVPDHFKIHSGRLYTGMVVPWLDDLTIINVIAGLHKNSPSYLLGNLNKDFFFVKKEESIKNFPTGALIIIQ